jgi:hypothetical protein
MVWLKRTEVFWITFTFTFNVVFTMHFFEMAPIRVFISPGFSEEQDFPQGAIYYSMVLEELLSGAPFQGR